MATALVTGLAGLILSVQPALGPPDIRDIIRFTADKVAEMSGSFRTDKHGYGRINAYEALVAKDDGEPDPPTNLQASTVWNPVWGQTHIKLTWAMNSANHVKGYNIYRKLDNGSYTNLGFVYQPTSSWEDLGLDAGKPGTGTAYYYLKTILVYNQISAASNIVSHYYRSGNPTKSSQPQPPIPSATCLMQNHPNPFNPSTVIKYAVRTEGRVMLRAYDVLGQQVATLVDEVQQAGDKSVEFDASKLPSGIYFYRLQAGKFTDVKKMILLK